MIKNFVKIALLFLIMLIGFSCRNTSDPEFIFKSAENLMEERPDSALVLLETIENPSELNNKDYATYALLLTQSRDKNFLDISGDTIIFSSLDYFKKEKDMERMALAYHYSGRVYMMQKEREKAVQDLLIARDLAEKAENYNLLGLTYFNLGDAYSGEYNYDKAIENYRLAYTYFARAGNKKNEKYILGYIGFAYLTKQPSQPDSALYYYNQVLEYAREQGDYKEEARILKSISLVYKERKQYDKAKQYIWGSIAADRDNRYIYSNYSNLAYTFIGKNAPDSAFYYIHKLADSVDENDLVDKYCYHELLYNTYKMTGDYRSALKDLELCRALADSIYEQTQQQSILNIQEKYKDEQLKTSLQRVVIHRQFLVIVTIIGIAVIIGLIRIFRVKSAENKRKIARVERNLETLNEMLHRQREQQNQVKQVLVDTLGLTRKVAQLNVIPPQDKKQLLEKYGKVLEDDMEKLMDWDQLYLLINNLYNNFADRVSRHFPDLTEKEKQLCCLVRADFRTDEISVILNYKYKSVSAMKSKLRDKMGFDSYDDFVAFVDHFQG